MVVSKDSGSHALLDTSDIVIGHWTMIVQIIGRKSKPTHTRNRASYYRTLGILHPCAVTIHKLPRRVTSHGD